MLPAPWLALPLAVLGGGPLDRALVELDDPSVLADIGARAVGPVAGGIAVVEVPHVSIEDLPRLPGVHQTNCAVRSPLPRGEGRGEGLRCGTQLHPHLDRSVPAAGVPALREALGDAGGGAGVVVGIVDTGVDPTHPDLLTEDGRARVAWIADLGEAPRGVHVELEELVGAAVYGPEEIQAAVDAAAPSQLGGRDRIGHGTHVASIAAGARGVAPEATLVVVKASREEEGTFDDADVVLATRFVFAVADALAQPAVVNLSLGGDDGGHDGASLLERGLAASLEERPEGRLIVAAAGNGAYLDGHAVAPLPPHAATDRVTLIVPRPAREGAPAFVRIGAWTTGTLAVAVEPPEGADPSRATVLPGAGGETSICLDRAEPGRWTLVLTGSGRADLWIAETDLVGPLGSFPRFGDHVNPGDQVTLPATAEEIVAVGAFATRTGWTDAGGEPHRTPTLREGDVSVFSARGPTRDGRAKPDLVAPGEAIVAALSSDADPRDPGSAFHHPGTPEGALVDDAHAVLWGTSAASAHVAGVAALLLARDPSLDSTRLRAVLAGAAAPREDEAWSVAHGWGALDAARTLAVLEPEGPAPPVDLDASLVSVVPDVAAPGETVRVLVSLHAADGASMVALPAATVHADGQGSNLPLTDLGGGRGEASFRVPADALGHTIAFEVQVDRGSLSRVALLEVAWRRDNLGASTRVSGGGCATAPHQSSSEILWLAGALLLALRRRASSI